MNDPYLSISRAVERLYKEACKHGTLYIAVDFDSTISPWNDVEGTTFDQVIGLVKECSDLGHHIIIYTASIPDRFDHMRQYCEERGIKVVAINKNAVDLPYGNHGKIYYNILLDDRAGLSAAYQILRQTLDKIYDNKTTN